MKVLIAGGNGSIGRRYAAILKADRIPFEIADDPNGIRLEHYKFDRLIIATPTQTHSKIAIESMRLGKPFLCEKPLAETVDEAKEVKQISDNLGVPGHIVSNWKVLAKDICKLDPPYRIKYDFYNSGRENMKWNMAQVIYLDPWAEIFTQSPRWNVKINGHEIRYRNLEQSYVVMLRKWLKGEDGLWDLTDGVTMVENCIQWDQRHGARYKQA